MHSMGFQTSDPQRNVMGQSTVRCHHLFLCFFGHSYSLEIFNRNFQYSLLITCRVNAAFSLPMSMERTMS